MGGIRDLRGRPVDEEAIPVIEPRSARSMSDSAISSIGVDLSAIRRRASEFGKDRDRSTSGAVETPLSSTAKPREGVSKNVGVLPSDFETAISDLESAVAVLIEYSNLTREAAATVHYNIQLVRARAEADAETLVRVNALVETLRRP